MANSSREHVQTLVIGGGQAGLTVGYYLAQRGLPFLILDASPRVGDAWRNRWDSLRLFTPARYDGLPGMRFPARGDVFPTKDQMADYLETYAKRFKLPIRNGMKVDRLWQEGRHFVATSGATTIEAENVIVAMGSHQKPRVPAFGRELDHAIRQLHAHEYRNPSQLQEGSVLIVGVGNSGADIGMEVARTHQTWLAGHESGAVPFRPDSFFGRFIGVRIVRFVGHYILTVATPVGRKLRPKLRFTAAPLIRVKPTDLVAAGIQRVPRMAGVKNGRPVLEDGRTLDVANVIWCTGFTNGFSWINLPIFGTDDGEPKYERGVVAECPGLFFVGLHFLYSMTSDTVTGVARDARRAVAGVAARVLAEKAAWQGNAVRAASGAPSASRV